ncbi:hypothetical protein [Peribacillus glennii]|uniref:Uncharacterized protein n=1 Tax=Peribacillus glennii TaxID=2303991 RepID=A0A372LG01_9BACI|nr:hypothetical protein [Peribacillus glennii]RFU65228.1 hypothetical protein D0466_04810 [Peribacillus glennii]
MKSRIHRCNCRKLWSVQNRKTTITASTVLLYGEWNTEVKPERITNPKGFVTTIHSEEIILNPANDVIMQFKKEGRLLYDKKDVDFNVASGQYLYFAEDGTCYMLSKRIGWD